MFTSFEAVLDHLDGLGLFHMDLSLNRMVDALKALGLDGVRQNGTCQKATRVPFTVQVLGTNGKGSTSTFLAKLAHAHGLRTGLYTSPHFVTPRERIRLFDTHRAGELLDDDRWPHLANRVHAAAPELTYFEFLTVLAVLAFAEEGVEFLVLEAGLGGRHDATTAVPVNGVCYTPIDLDHTKVLGDTIALIAEDKAAAMRENGFVITGPQSAEAMDVLNRVAHEKGLVLHHAETMAPLPQTPLGLAGPHQRHNARLALAVWTHVAPLLGCEIRPQAVADALADAHLPGRFQIVPAKNGDPAFILDGGHNAHGLRACEVALADSGLEPSAIIFSCLADKDVDSLLPIVKHMASKTEDRASKTLILTPTIQDNERAMDGEVLAARLQAMGLQAEPMPRLGAALDRVRHLHQSDPNFAKPLVLVCGSLYLLGEFYTLRPQWL